MKDNVTKFNVEIVENNCEWESILEKLDTSSTYMKWSWGEYKIKRGWGIKHLQIIEPNSKKLIACCLLQSKSIAFINIYLIQGGIHLSKEVKIKNVFSAIHLALRSYVNEIKINNWMWLLLINYQAHSFENADISLMKIGFKPILTNKMYTFIVPAENLHQEGLSLSNNWRHNLKRAKNNIDLKTEWVLTFEDRVKILTQLSEFYRELKNRKKFKSAFDFIIGSEFLAKDKSIMIVKAKLRDEVVAIRVASLCNDHLLDFLAASNEGAKKCYANYLLMWEVIMKMKELGKNYFDTGGIDPTSNLGVYNFKKGLNGELVINGPVWCMGSNSLLVWLTRLYFT